MDTITPEIRSKVMSAIHSRDTLPEMRVRKMLWANGYRFRVCDKRITGHPDIVIPRCRALIEVRGCFWHQHGWECALKTEKEREKTFAFVLGNLAKWGKQ